MAINSYRDLDVWKKSVDTAVVVYDITKDFPSDERFGLISQMRRSSVSIPSNIAEGYRRNSRRNYARFIAIAFGSGAELETQLEIALRLKYLSVESYNNLTNSLNEVMRMLNGLHRSLSGNPYSQLPTANSL